MGRHTLQLAQRVVRGPDRPDLAITSVPSTVTLSTQQPLAPIDVGELGRVPVIVVVRIRPSIIGLVT
jgi:hypothetical protein